MSNAPQFPDPLGVREVYRPGATAHKAGPDIVRRVQNLEQGAAGRPGPGVSNGSVLTSDTSQTGGVRWENHGIVSSLPASPVDGQHCYYQNAAMATAGVVWHLIYDADQVGSYKWVPVGGGQFSSRDDTIQTTTSTSFVSLTGALSLVTPLAGDYDIRVECDAFTTVSGAVLLSFQVGASAATDTDAVRADGVNQQSGMVTRRKTSLSASTTITEKARVASGTGWFLKRRLALIPVRVG